MDRKKLLIKRLGEHGLELRSDSKLCKKFIDTGTPDIDEVVATMIDMDFMHNSDYFDILRYERNKRIDKLNDDIWKDFKKRKPRNKYLDRDAEFLFLNGVEKIESEISEYAKNKARELIERGQKFEDDCDECGGNFKTLGICVHFGAQICDACARLPKYDGYKVELM